MCSQFSEFDDIMHQFYHAVRTSEGEESGEDIGKQHLIVYLFGHKKEKKHYLPLVVFIAERLMCPSKQLKQVIQTELS